MRLELHIQHPIIGREMEFADWMTVAALLVRAGASGPSTKMDRNCTRKKKPPPKCLQRDSWLRAVRSCLLSARGGAEHD